MIIKLTITILFLAPYIFWTESSVFLGSKQFQEESSIWTQLHPKFKVGNTLSVVEPPLLIGSFNIQTLTRKKFEKTHVMDVVEQIIHRYDLVLILEIHTNDDYHTKKLLRDLNRDLPPGEVYNMVLSEKHNITMEHYAIYYKYSASHKRSIFFAFNFLSSYFIGCFVHFLRLCML